MVCVFIILDLYMHLCKAWVNKPWHIGPISSDGYKTDSVSIVCKISRGFELGGSSHCRWYFLFVLGLKTGNNETSWNRWHILNKWKIDICRYSSELNTQSPFRHKDSQGSRGPESKWPGPLKIQWGPYEILPEGNFQFMNWLHLYSFDAMGSWHYTCPLPGVCLILLHLMLWW